jgi:hypothetical protein
MKLLTIESKPTLVLRSLVTARTLVAEKNRELTGPIDELIELVSQFIDEDPSRESAVSNARKVAKILVNAGGVAARESLGVPPPNPLRQEAFIKSSQGFRDPEEAADIADKMHAVEIEVDDDTACCVGGAKYMVSATIYLPIDLDKADKEESLDRGRPTWPKLGDDRLRE